MNLIGKKLTAFTSDVYQSGKDFYQITDKDFLGRWTVVCFYPADFTFVCPTELEDLEKEYAVLKSMGAEVFSVSTDSHFVHKAWHESSKAVGSVTYGMIGDPNHQLSNMFGVLNTESGMADRGTFIVDPDGVIQMVEISAGAIGRDASALIPKLKAVKFVRENPGEVCPAKWQEGAETLKPSFDLVGKI